VATDDAAAEVSRALLRRALALAGKAGAREGAASGLVGARAAAAAAEVEAAAAAARAAARAPRPPRAMRLLLAGGGSANSEPPSADAIRPLLAASAGRHVDGGDDARAWAAAAHEVDVPFDVRVLAALPAGDPRLGAARPGVFADDPLGLDVLIEISAAADADTREGARRMACAVEREEYAHVARSGVWTVPAPRKGGAPAKATRVPCEPPSTCAGGAAC